MPHGRTPPQHAVIGYVHGGTVRAEFLASLLGLHRTRTVRTRIDAVLAAPSGPNISEARNLLCRRFLEETAAPWLWFLDTDMVFAPDALDRLIAAADPVERPVLGALCFSQNTDDPGAAPYPVMYELTGVAGALGFIRYAKWPEGAVLQVAATGAACLLIHRGVLEAVEKLGDRAAPWFRESVNGTALIGEDLTFCLRCGAAGIPVHVHTGVQAGHIKPVMLGTVT